MPTYFITQDTFDTLEKVMADEDGRVEGLVLGESYVIIDHAQSFNMPGALIGLSISGDAVVGQTLVASRSGGQWFADEQPLNGATDVELFLSQDREGEELTYIEGGETATSVTVVFPKPVITVHPTFGEANYFEGDTITFGGGETNYPAPFALTDITLDGNSVSGDLVNGNLPTTGYAAGTIAATFDATNSGGTSDPVTITVSLSEVPENAPSAFADDQWALSGPRPNGVDIVVFENPADGGTAISSLEYRVNGGAAQSMSISGPGIYALTGVPEVYEMQDDNGHDRPIFVQQTRRVEIRASNGAAGPWSSVDAFSTIPEDPRGFRGWDPAFDLGTGADAYFAPYGSDTSGSGTLLDPYATPSHALSQVTTGQMVRGRAGVYPDGVNLTDDKSIQGYGTERPHITAGEALSGLTRCTTADAVILGPTLGVNGSPVFKADVPLASLEFANPISLNMHEAGRKLTLAMDRADNSDPFAFGDDSTYYQADNFTEDGNGDIETITDTSVLNSTNYTDAQVLAAAALVYGEPNVSDVAPITAADMANNVITVDTTLDRQDDADATTWLWGLINIAPKLAAGQWAVVDDGTTATIYVYPFAEENLSFVTYASRERVVTIDAASTGSHIRGLHLSQATSEGTGSGQTVYCSAGAGKTSDHLIEYCLHTGCTGILNVARAVYLQNCDDTIARRNTFYDISGRGIYFSSQSGVRGTKNATLRNHFERIGGAGFYAYTQQDHVEAHNYAKDTGLEAHANKSNHYSPSIGFDGLLFWANEMINCRGYVVWQALSAPNAAFNILEIKNGGDPWQRTLTDDAQVFADIPVNNTDGHVFNNGVYKHPTNPEGGKAIDVARPSTDVTYSLDNNIAHGMDDPTDFNTGNLPAADSVQSNVVTYIASSGGQSSSDFDLTNVVETNLSAVFTDIANRDYSPAPGSVILTTAGQDKTSTITALTARFTQFSDFDRDVFDQVIDWTVLPVGPDTSLPFVRGLDLTALNVGAGGATLGNATVRTQSGLDVTNHTIHFGLKLSTDSAPTVADLKAGTGIVAKTTLALTSAGVQNIDWSGTTASTEYTPFVVMTDGTLDGVLLTGANFTTLAVDPVLDIEQAVLSADTAHKNSQPYDPIAFVPNVSGNTALFVVALHGSADISTLSATWRGQSLTPLLVSTVGQANTRTDVIALFSAVAGSGSGDFVVTPVGETNAMAAGMVELEGLGSGGLIQSIGVEDGSTASTSLTATLTGVAAGNTVISIAGISADQSDITVTGSDLAEQGQVTSQVGGSSVSNMTMQVQALTDVPTTGDYTAALTYPNGAQGAMLVFEMG